MKYVLPLTVLLLCSSAYAQTITRIVSNDPPGLSGDGGPATAAQAGLLSGIAKDSHGNIYIGDRGNYRIRKITPEGIISTYAGSTGSSYYGNNIPATAARLSVSSIVIDQDDNLYFTDIVNNRVRKIFPSGIIRTVAGTGSTAFNGDGLSATTTNINHPSDIAIDNAGNLYISETGGRVRMINSMGIMTTIAGTGVPGYSGDGGPGTAAMINGPNGIAADAYGNVYFCDANNFRIRKITPSGTITTIAGNGVYGIPTDGAVASTSPLGDLFTLALDNTGAINFSTGYSVLYKISLSGQLVRIVGDYATPTPAFYEGMPAFDLVTALYGSYTDEAGFYFLGNGGGLFFIRNSPPRFVHGAHQYIAHCAAGATVNLDTALSVIDTNSMQQPAWSLTSPPHHGVAAVAYTTNTANGSILVPSGLTYTPNPGYSGQDTFTVAVANNAYADFTTIFVQMPITPLVSVATSPAIICMGNEVSLSASGVYGGPTPLYTWYVGGTAVHVGPVYTYTPSVGDVVHCKMRSSDYSACLTTDTAWATTIVNVTPPVTPAVSITTSANDSVDYLGELVHFFSNVTYGGTAPTYQWYENGIAVPGATAASYTTGLYASASVYCEVTSNLECAAPATVASNVKTVIGDYLGLTELHAGGQQLVIYPQPATGSFTVKCPQPEADISWLSIRSMTGGILYSIPVNTTAPIRVDHNFPAGVYTLSIRSGKHYWTKKLLINP